MTLKAILLIGFVFAAGSLTLQTSCMSTDPASSLAGFFLFRAHCPMPEPTTTTSKPATQNDDPVATMVHLLQANVPF